MNVHTHSVSASGYWQRGQGAFEFLIVILAFGGLLLGILQAALFYRAKTTVDYAAFIAARNGSLHGASQSSLQNGLIKGLAPLYATKANAVGLAAAEIRAAAAVKLGSQARVEVVSPTTQMFNQLAVKQFDGVKAIPNDSLPYRSKAVRAANLLKVKVVYNYPLIVPVIDRLIGTKTTVVGANGVPTSMYVLPIQAQATVRMQSPIRDRSLLARGGGGGTSSGGGSGGGSGSGGGGGTGGGGGSGGGGTGGGGGSGGGSGGGPPHVCI